jgi:hypothetical protein
MARDLSRRLEDADSNSIHVLELIRSSISHVCPLFLYGSLSNETVFVGTMCVSGNSACLWSAMRMFVITHVSTPSQT